MFEALVNLKKFSFKTKNEAKKLEETQNRLKLYCDNAIQSCTKLFPNNDVDYGFDFVVKMFTFLYPNNYANLIKDNTVVRTKSNFLIRTCKSILLVQYCNSNLVLTKFGYGF